MRNSGEKEFIQFRYDGRFSGDARTYQGNTLTNHYLIRSLQEHFGYKAPYFVSGDDGLMAVPAHLTDQQLTTFFGDLGFSVKLAQTEISTSGFCGFNFDTENHNRRLAADIVEVVLDFFTCRSPLSGKKYLDYLYDKALCLLHEYNADPVLRPGLKAILSKPRRYDVNSVRTDWWDRYLVEKDNVSIASLLEQPTSSFVRSASIHKNGLTPGEEEEIAFLFLQKVRRLFQGEPDHALEDYLENFVPRAVLKFSELNTLEKEDGLYAWSPSAYDKLFS